jgi:hypothetical protein
MIGDVLLVGGFAVAVVSAFRRPGATEPVSGELRAEAAIREALRGAEAASVRAEFRGRGVQSPERRLDRISFVWR